MERKTVFPAERYGGVRGAPSGFRVVTDNFEQRHDGIRLSERRGVFGFNGERYRLVDQIACAFDIA